MSVVSFLQLKDIKWCIGLKTNLTIVAERNTAHKNKHWHRVKRYKKNF
jgi:hypothetical protein